MRFEDIQDDDMAAGLTGWMDEAREALDALGETGADIVKVTASHMIDVVKTARPMTARNEINMTRHNLRTADTLGTLYEATSLNALVYWMERHEHVDGVDDDDMRVWREWVKQALQEAVRLVLEQEYTDDEKRAYNAIVELSRARGVKPQRADGWTAWELEKIDEAIERGLMKRDSDRLKWIYNEKPDGTPHKVSLGMWLASTYHVKGYWRQIPYKRWGEAMGYSVKRAVEEAEKPNRRRQQWENELNL